MTACKCSEEHSHAGKISEILAGRMGQPGEGQMQMLLLS